VGDVVTCVRVPSTNIATYGRVWWCGGGGLLLAVSVVDSYTKTPKK